MAAGPYRSRLGGRAYRTGGVQVADATARRRRLRIAILGGGPVAQNQRGFPTVASATYRQPSGV